MSRMRKIEDIETWKIARAYLREHNYMPWQSQYGFDSPEGYHAWFIDLKHEDIEIVTFSEEVQNAIIKYKRRPSK